MPTGNDPRMTPDLLHARAPMGHRPIERQDHDDRAQQALAAAHTNKPRPNGCFILRKGVAVGGNPG